MDNGNWKYKLKKNKITRDERMGILTTEKLEKKLS